MCAMARYATDAAASFPSTVIRRLLPMSDSLSCSSIGFQSRRLKNRAVFLGGIIHRRFDVLERVRDAELFPLEAPHLMERQHIDALHVAETAGKVGDLGDVVGIVRYSRDQHVSNPNRPASVGEASGEVQSGTNVHAR